MHYTPEPPKQQSPPEYIVTKFIKDGHPYFQVCDRAQSLTAYSLTHQRMLLYALPCRTWSCRWCAQVKIKQLASMVMEAKPNRLLTLTVDPSMHLSPKAAWEATRKQVPILIRRLRKKFGEVEYLRVTEVTKNGWPHYHLLIRSGFIPHSVVKAYWLEQTGARIVDLRQVTKTFSAYKYLIKYLSKLHHLEWTERHVSLSRAFAPKTDWKDKVKIETAEPDLHRRHPADWAAEYLEGRTLVRLAQNIHLILEEGETHNPLRKTLDEHLGDL